ncbi:AI-2E family transporter [Actinomycetospora sp. CA-101289]|uniref:AI-2E family transporter n=1 Tax=Actinomycetospora sp. CA-101289 TaxID=3239893 RepID=UPI003D98F6A0
MSQQTQDLDGAARRAHHDFIGQPHTPDEGPIARAEASADGLSTPDAPLGPLGPPLDRRSTFLRGAAAAAGVVLVLTASWLVYLARSELVLIGLALFLALGAEPVVSWLVRHRWPRWLGVLAVVVVGLAAATGFVLLVGPLLADQAAQAPAYLRAAQDRGTLIGDLNARFGLQEYLTGDQAFAVGRTVFGALGSTVVVVVLAVYFVADLPRIRRTAYRFVPASRRPRAVLLGDAIAQRVGGYVLGNVLVSLIAGLSSLAVLLALGVPYPFLLATVVAVLDLVPVAGSVTAGIIASLVAFTVSPTVGGLTVGFFVLYRFLEDYLVFPGVVGRVVKVPALLTLIAVLLGGALYGIIGVLIAIPIAAAAHLLLHETVFPRLDADD